MRSSATSSTLPARPRRSKSAFGRMLAGRVRRLRRDRAQRGLGRRGHQDARRAQGRPLRASTARKVWISNAPLASMFVVFAKTDAGGAAQGHQRVLRRSRHARPERRQAAGQARTARRSGRGGVPQRCRGAGQRADRRRGRRFRDRDEGVRPLAPDDRGARRGPDAALPGRERSSTPRRATPWASRSSSTRPSATRSPTWRVRTEAARLLAHQAAWLLDTGRSNTRQAAYAKAVRRRQRHVPPRPRPCRSSAAWATVPSTRSRSCSATPRCCRSTRAPARSSAISSPASFLGLSRTSSHRQGRKEPKELGHRCRDRASAGTAAMHETPCPWEGRGRASSPCVLSVSSALAVKER